MPKFDLEKPYKTRGGLEVFTKLAPDGLLHGWSIASSGFVRNHTWSVAGFVRDDHGSYDLVNVPETRTVDVWLNINEDYASAHKTKETADSYADKNRLACVKRSITYTVGEGLETQ